MSLPNTIGLLSAAVPSTNGTTSRLRGAGQFFAILKTVLTTDGACKVQHSVDGVNWLDVIAFGASAATISVSGTYFYGFLNSYVRAVSNGTNTGAATAVLTVNDKGEVGITEAFTPPVTTPAVAATGTATFSGVGTAADTVTVAGTVYTLRALIDTDAAGEVAIAASATLTAANLAAAINGNVLNAANASVSATSALGVVTVTARAPGLTGNAITLAKVSTAVTVSAATLASGAAIVYADGPGATIERFMGLTASN